jgi:hypothetical protein
MNAETAKYIDQILKTCGIDTGINNTILARLAWEEGKHPLLAVADADYYLQNGKICKSACGQWSRFVSLGGTGEWNITEKEVELKAQIEVNGNLSKTIYKEHSDTVSKSANSLWKTYPIPLLVADAQRQVCQNLGFGGFMQVPVEARPDLSNLIEEWKELKKEITNTFTVDGKLDTSFVNFSGINASKMTLIAFIGNLRGFDTMTALQHYTISKGQLTPSLQGMIDNFRKEGGKVVWDEAPTKEKASVTLTFGEMTASRAFTFDDVKRAGLDQKATYKQFPEKMLQSFCFRQTLSLVGKGIANMAQLEQEAVEKEENQETVQEQSAPVVSAPVVETQVPAVEEMTAPAVEIPNEEESKKEITVVLKENGLVDLAKTDNDLCTEIMTAPKELFDGLSGEELADFRDETSKHIRQTMGKMIEEGHKFSEFEITQYIQYVHQNLMTSDGVIADPDDIKAINGGYKHWTKVKAYEKYQDSVGAFSEETKKILSEKIKATEPITSENQGNKDKTAPVMQEDNAIKEQAIQKVEPQTESNNEAMSQSAVIKGKGLLNEAEMQFSIKIEEGKIAEILFAPEGSTKQKSVLLENAKKTENFMKWIAKEGTEGMSQEHQNLLFNTAKKQGIISKSEGIGR